MNTDKIREFNRSLINDLTKDYNIIDYIHKINSFSNNPINDLSFMNELMQYIDNDTCCIPHILLVKYGVLSGKNTSADTQRLMEQYEFIEGYHYLLCNVAEQLPSGAKYKVNYMLHPTAFKYCLIRSKNTKLYTKYYMLLETSIYFYNEYQHQYKNYMLSCKDDKIDKLSQNLKEHKDIMLDQSKQINDQSKQINDLIEQNKELLNYAKDTKEQLNIMEEDLSIVQDKLDIAVEDRAVKPINTNKVNQLLILKEIKNNNIFYIVCGQASYIRSIIRTKKNTHTTSSIINNVPNSIYLFNHVKHVLNSDVKVNGRNIILLTINEEQLIDIIKSIFDGRRDIDLTKRP